MTLTVERILFSTGVDSLEAKSKLIRIALGDAVLLGPAADLTVVDLL